MRDLTFKPGTVSRSYVIGNRVQYIPPVSYFVIITAILLIYLSLLDVSFSEMIATSQQSINPDDITDEGLKFQIAFNDWFVRNFRTLSFLQIPFIAWWAKVLFRKAGFNFVENTVLAFYTHGHLVWLSFIGATTFKLFGTGLSGLTILGTFIYFSWACIAFYNQTPVKSFIKGIFVQILSLTTFGLIVFVTLFTYINYINPQFLQSP